MKTAPPPNVKARQATSTARMSRWAAVTPTAMVTLLRISTTVLIAPHDVSRYRLP
jgi:hypothetical protein